MGSQGRLIPMGITIISTVVTAAAAAFAGQGAYDLVDLATVRTELQLADQSRDADLRRWITQASARAAKFANRVFPVELLQDQFFPERDPFPQVAIGNIDPLQLARWPIAASPCMAGTAAPLAPVLSQAAGGVLPPARVYVRITYVTAAGETAVSAESSLGIAANCVLQVAAPAADALRLATGWNVYVGTVSGSELRQNAAPIALGTPWSEPATGLLTGLPGLAMPGFVSVIENGIPLIEGVDFLTDFDEGQLTRLDVNAWPKRWPKWPIVVLYPAGYVFSDPRFADAQDAVIQIVQGRYRGQGRDPELRSQNIAGAYSATYRNVTGTDTAVGDLTPGVRAMLERYRVPVIG